MPALSKKIDFAVVFKVENANPNGDPLSGNRPRTDFFDFGEVSDVCLKRKIRNRLLDKGESIFVQSDDYKNDDARSLKDRTEKILGKIKDENVYRKEACKKWIDVRTFGQIFAFKAEAEKGSGVSIGIRGPVSIQSAFSKEPIEIVSTQITKSVNSENTKNNTRGSDTMGMKHRVKYGIYVFKGAMNPQLAEKTGFGDDDAEKIKSVLPKIFENDASSARPEGSMEVLKFIWWEQNSKLGRYSSARVHHSLEVDNNGNIENEEDLKNGTVESIKGLKAEIIPGW